MGSDFEFIDVGEDFILGLGDGLEVDKGFCFEVGGEECFSKGVFEVGKDSELLVDGIGGEGHCPS